MKIAVTGHRPSRLNNEYDGQGPCSDFIRSKINKIVDKYNPTLMISGMALGVDMIFAEVAIKRNIELLAAIPCLNQEKVWPQTSQDRYHKILSYENCKSYIVTNCTYNSTVMFNRNKYMVDYCDLLIGFYDGSKGGTQHCLNYAKKQNKQTLIIDPMGYIHD